MGLMLEATAPIALLVLAGYWALRLPIPKPLGRIIQQPSGNLSRAGHPTPKLRKLISNRLPVVVYQALADEIGKTLFATGAVEEVFGYQTEEWLAMPNAWYNSLHPSDKHRVIMELASIEDGESKELVYRIRHRDGDWRWLRDTVTAYRDEDGLKYHLGVITNITRERELERSSFEIKRFFEGLLNSGPWMLFRLEGEDLNIEYVSPNLKSIMGFEAEKILGKKMPDFATEIHPEDRRIYLRFIRRVKQVGRAHCRVRVNQPAGDYRWIELSTHRVEERPDVYLGYALDVHEQVRNEASLRRYLEQQRELNHLGAFAWKTTEPLDFIERALAAIEKLLQPECCVVLKSVPEKGYLQAVAGKGVRPGHKLPIDDSQAGYTYKHEESIVTYDLAADERFAIPKEAMERGITSSISVPIPGISEPFGVLGLGYKNRLHIDETTVRFVQSVAQMIGQVQRQRIMLDDLEHKAYYDDLTNLPNRRALYRKLGALLANPEGEGMVAFLDLVDFGEVNDTWGHEAGDQLLRLTAERLRDSEGWAARWGGDEFVLLIVGDDPRQILRRIMARLSKPLAMKGRMTQLRARAGVVLFREHGSDTETLFRRADTALSAAKEKNQEILEYYPGLEKEASERRSLVEALREALDSREGLSLDFQPIIRIGDGKIVAAESLLRWRQPGSEKPVPPAVFVPLAERYGLSPALDRLVLDMALKAGATWIERLGDKAPSISVNISPESFSEIRFVGELRALLAYTGFPPKRLTLEITERVLADSERVRPVLAALQELGVGIVLDDFGTGYSSLAYLANLGIDGLKVDRAFVGDIGRNRRTEAVLRSIFALGENLGMKVTAEGVENEQQLDWLRRESCDLAQGYHLGKPISKEEFAKKYF